MVRFSSDNVDGNQDVESGITFSVPEVQRNEGHTTFSPSSKREPHLDKEFLKKIPVGAEGMTVLVGSLDTIDHAVVAFVRLSAGHLLDNMMQVPIPVRFFFMLIGPSTDYVDYHEVGRVISTLMSNKVTYGIILHSYYRYILSYLLYFEIVFTSYA